MVGVRVGKDRTPLAMKIAAKTRFSEVRQRDDRDAGGGVPVTYCCWFGWRGRGGALWSQVRVRAWLEWVEYTNAV